MSANVNVPTNIQQKERDVNQKLQLYGIYSAFANGKVPSNKQIDVALNSALASKPLTSPSSKLSEEGRMLVTDLKEVIKQAKHLLLSKNDGNLIQSFIWDAQHIDAAGASLPGAPTDRDTARQHGQQAVDGLKTLGTLILSNGQFRKLLSDATVLIRDMAGDAAQKTANKVNPSEDALNQIDKPADDNTWHDVPDLSAGSLKQQARSTIDKNKPFSRGEAKQIANESMDTAQNHPSGSAQDSGAAGARDGASKLQERASQNIPEETKQNARDTKNATVQSTKNYLSKKMPEERREQTIWRLKKMIVEIQGHPDYQQAVETLLSLAETYGGHASTVSKSGAGTVQGAHQDTSLNSAETNLRILIERFANYTSLDDFFDSLNQIYRDADRDPELKNWFKSLDTYVRKCLREQGYILKDSSTDEWNRLYDKGQFLFRERYRDHTDHILDEVKFLADQFDSDPQNKAFGDAVQRLFLNLGNDDSGKAAFKPHLIKDVFEVIIPGIFESTRYVPIPRIEASDPMIDVVVENLVVESNNLFPNVLEFSSDNYFRMGRRQVASKRDNKIMIAASGIQCDLRDVAYYIKKKQGFPGITDKGVMDIILGGEGFSFKAAARNAQRSDRTHFIAIDKIDVTIKNLNIKLKKSNHKLLFGIAKPLVLKVMRPAIQKVIEKQIKSNIEQADAFLYSIYQDAQRSIKAAQNDPENAPNMYQQYVTAVQNRIGQKKQKAEEKASDMKVNMAVTQQDSMFKNIALPGGISTKATEYKELAAKGNKWESPVFSIGSARESSDIPAATKVQRKNHSTRSAGIRGGNHPNANSGPTSSGTGSNTGLGNTSGMSGNTGSAGGYNIGGATGGAGGYDTSVPSSGYGVADSTGGYGVADSTSGYGTADATRGYGTTAPTSGYGTTASNGGYGTAVPTGGYGTTGATGATSGFGTQVDQAFNSETGAGNTASDIPSYYEGVTQHPR